MDRSTAATNPVRAFLAALLVSAVGLLAGTALTVAVILPLGFAGIIAFQDDLAILLVLSLVLTQGVAFGGTALGYLRYRGLPLDYVRARIPSLRDLLYVGGGYVLAFAGLVVGSALITFLTQAADSDVEPASNQVGELGIQNPELLLLLIPLSILLIGPGEELLFRGIVQGRLRESLGPVPAILLASAIFASIHFMALTGGSLGRLATIGILFFPSLVFGTAYELSENIVVPSLIHGLYNATLFVGAYFFISGGRMALA